MNPRLWFVVPVHGRIALAQICLRQLRRTCDALTAEGIDASAVVIADHSNLGQLGDTFGFATVVRDNRFLSRKFNDGIQLALDPRFNPDPADYIVPCGSDDWVDHRLFLDLPDERTVVGFQRMSFVREDGQEISTTILDYRGGSGIRIYPRQLLEPAEVGYRPADEDRARACDTSILTNLSRYHGDHLHVDHRHLHDRQIVDWKTTGTQLNPYEAVVRARRSSVHLDPFVELAGVYPDESLEEMRAHYSLQVEVAA